jgi:hypothetical protein
MDTAPQVSLTAKSPWGPHWSDTTTKACDAQVLALIAWTRASQCCARVSLPVTGTPTEQLSGPQAAPMFTATDPAWVGGVPTLTVTSLPSYPGQLQ